MSKKKSIMDPFPNFHSARIKDPNQFEKIIQLKELPNGIRIIGGPLKSDPQGSSQEQAYRFPKEKFTVAQAKSWLEKEKIKPVLFEKATKKEDGTKMIITEVFDKDGNLVDTFETEIKEDKEYLCECIKCGYKISSDKHCDELECPECGGRMRRNNRPGIGKDSENILFHLDAFDESKLFLTEKAETTPEGYLKTRAIVTNTGIFNYVKQDGTILKELRPPEQVFDYGSLQTLKNKPITDGHPEDLITSDNIEDLQKKGVIIGFTGSNVRNDGHVVSIDMVITNKDAIEQINSGEKRSLSCGYKATLDFSQSGMAYGNNQYDCVQKDITYNHVALVPFGRAGDLAKIRMDSITDDMVIQFIDQKTKKEDFMSDDVKGKIIIDGVEYTVNPDVAKLINGLQSDLDDANKKIAVIQKEKTEIEAKKDVLETEVKTLKEKDDESGLNDSELLLAVNERIDLIKIADFLEIKYQKDTSNKELKLAIIKKKNEKINLIDKDDVYINAYFDSVKDIISIDIENSAKNKNKKTVFGDYVNEQNDQNNNQKQQPKNKKEMYDSFVENIKKQSLEYNGSASIKNGELVINN